MSSNWVAYPTPPRNVVVPAAGFGAGAALTHMAGRLLYDQSGRLVNAGSRAAGRLVYNAAGRIVNGFRFNPYSNSVPGRFLRYHGRQPVGLGKIIKCVLLIVFILV